MRRHLLNFLTVLSLLLCVAAGVDALTVAAGLAAVAVYFAASVLIGRWAGVAVILAMPVVLWAVFERPEWVRCGGGGGGCASTAATT